MSFILLFLILIISLCCWTHWIVMIIAGVANNISPNEASNPPHKTILKCNKIWWPMNGKEDVSWECFHCSDCKLIGINTTKGLLYVMKNQGQNVFFLGQKFLMNVYAVTKISALKLMQTRRRDKNKVTIETISLMNFKKEKHHSWSCQQSAIVQKPLTHLTSLWIWKSCHALLLTFYHQQSIMFQYYPHRINCQNNLKWDRFFACQCT